MESTRFFPATMAIPEFSPKPSQIFWTLVREPVCACILAPFSVFKIQIIFYYKVLDTQKSELKPKYKSITRHPNPRHSLLAPSAAHTRLQI